jgi:hypothetical protein
MAKKNPNGLPTKYTDFTHDEIGDVFEKIKRIKSYINNNNPHNANSNHAKSKKDNKIRPNEWYVGITGQKEEERKNQYSNPAKWICIDCSTDAISRHAERYFNNFYNTEGSGGGGDGEDSEKLLYCFFIEEQQRKILDEKEKKRASEKV